MSVSIILPTLNRPKRLKNCIDSLRANSRSTDDIELIPIIDSNDDSTRNLLTGMTIKYLSMPPGVSPVEKWNYGLRHSFKTWIMLAADDIEFTNDWLYRSVNTANHGFLGFHDERSKFDKGFMPHFMATQSWLTIYQNGVLCVPHYKHWGLDLEICARAIRSNTYAISQAAIIHQHEFFNGSLRDPTYDKAKPHQQADIDMFHTRQVAGFPDDFDSII